MKNLKKSITLLIIALMMSLTSQAQFVDVPQPSSIFEHPAHKQMKDAYKSKDFKTTLILASELIERYPQHSDGYLYAGMALQSLEKNKEAFKYYSSAFYLEPNYHNFAMNTAVAGLYAKEAGTIKEVLRTASFIPVSSEQFTTNYDFLKNYETAFAGYSEYAAVFQAFKTSLASLKNDYPNHSTYYKQNMYAIDNVTKADIEAGKGPQLLASLQKVKTDVDSGAFPTGLYYYIANYFSKVAFVANDNDLLNDLRPILYAGMIDKKLHPLTRFNLYETLVAKNKRDNNDNDIVTLSNIMYDDLKNIVLTNGITAKILYNKTAAYARLQNLNESKEMADVLQTYLPVVKNQPLKIQMYTVILVANITKDPSLAEKIGKEGQAYIDKMGWSGSELDEIHKAAFESFHLMSSKTSQVVENKVYTDYTVAYNDAATFIQSRNYGPAIPILLQAKGLIEKQIATADALKKPGLLSIYSNICGKLIGCYKQENQADKIIPIAEDMRSNSLAEATSTTKKGRASLKEIQDILKADEALVYYIDVSQGSSFEGVFMGVVVTKEKIESDFINSNGFLMAIYAGQNKMVGEIEKTMAQREFRSPSYTKYNSFEEGENKQLAEGELALLIEVYRHNISPDPTELANGYGTYKKAMGNAFYADYIYPLESYFKNKKKLIFSLDGVLNFLPFETFNNQDEIYLVQQYDISYINSGTVLRNLRQRKPQVYSKNMLAFGDATYQVSSNPGRTLKSSTDIERLRIEVDQSLAKGENLDYAFATLYTQAAPYLIGTKQEVEAIAQIVPKSDIKLNDMMTENELKRLSNNGELNNYRVLHIASHASVDPYIFNLSGIMFTTTPEPVDGEDGIMVVDEVAKLKMRPEFVMLSACQTGLGKIVPGEGVAGLNYSLLNAGANATLTSLWSVNDYATAVFVKSLYTKVFVDKRSFKTATNEVKRDFIEGRHGEELKDPQYWAPFIYFGN